jgi:hypothetical protein
LLKTITSSVLLKSKDNLVYNLYIHAVIKYRSSSVVSMPASQTIHPLIQCLLDSHPFYLLLGSQLAPFAPERAGLQIPLTPNLMQQHGFVHSGVISYLAVNALTFAGGSLF